jgi:5-methyltetrahydrofolate--homocysteine methyltransferase
VKGDVHDISKNLVEIILANNGFNVINLGIKVPPQDLIQAIQTHSPDVVGLSGLLVKSAQQMVTTAEDFTRAGIRTPILVGGAALSEGFVDRHISRAYPDGLVAYASDAMSGLELAKVIVEPEKRDAFTQKLNARRAEQASQAPKATVAVEPETQERSPSIRILSALPKAPDLDRHVIRNTPIDQIWNWINPLMLYGRHLGVKGGVVRKLEALSGDPAQLREIQEMDSKAYDIWCAVQDFKQEIRNTPLMAPVCVYQFFEAHSEGNSLTLVAQDTSLGQPKETRFTFPRQRKSGGLCLSDYTSPKNQGPRDTVACFVTHVGVGVREEAERLKNRGEYLKSHILQALALESAEAYAELIHSQIRKSWGFADPPQMTLMERFQAKYRGKRYSFGYPACPRLDDQAPLFDLLKPQEIGVELTEGFMMDPEASVSAIVFHHPDATYFSVGSSGAWNDDNRA